MAREEQGKARADRTRADVVAGWGAVAKLLQDDADFQLADRVLAFVRQMPAVRLQRELLTEDVRLRQRLNRAIAPLDRTR